MYTYPLQKELIKVEDHPRLLLRVIEESDSPLVIADALEAEHPIIYCNRAFEELTGYSRTEVAGKNLRFLQGNETDDQAVKKIRKALRTKQIVQVRLKNYRKDGTMFWNDLTIVPVRNKKGKATHFLGMQADVTDEVERRRQKEDFVSVVSHELRNPLLIVMMYTELIQNLLRESSVDPSVVLYVKKIEEAAERIERLLKDLQDVATVETGNLKLKRSRFNMTKLLQSCAEDMNKMHNAEIEVRCNSSDCYASGDKTRIRQVVVNLITNALKHSGKNKALLMLEKDKGALKCTVRDYGKGISKKDTQFIFEKYGRIKNSEEAKTEGLGLGLYISMSIVDKHGGKLWVESEPGKGARFIFTLPSTKSS